MNHTRLWIAAAIIAAVILGGFLLSAPHTTELKEAAAPEAPVPAPAVTLHDAFKKGVHTLSGTVLAPDACAQVSATASATSAASGTPSIAVAISMPQDSGICLAVPTPMPFRLTVTAPAHVPINVTVNGETASTTAS